MFQKKSKNKEKIKLKEKKCKLSIYSEEAEYDVNYKLS